MGGSNCSGSFGSSIGINGDGRCIVITGLGETKIYNSDEFIDPACLREQTSEQPMNVPILARENFGSLILVGIVTFHFVCQSC